MLPGIGSFAFGWAVRIGHPPMSEAALLEFARGHGVSVVQLGDNLPAHRRSAEDRSALKQEARQAGLQLELGERGLTETHLQTYLGLCTELDCSLLRFVADADSYEPAPTELAALLRNATPALAAVGVTLALENHDRLPARTLRRLIDDVASEHVGICLDTANSLGAGEGLEHVTELLASVTVNVHVKDVTIGRLPHLMGFVVEGCSLGQGQLDIRPLIDRLRRQGYRGSIILESWSPPGNDDPSTVAAELAAAHAGLDTLKTWLR